MVVGVPLSEDDDRCCVRVTTPDGRMVAVLVATFVRSDALLLRRRQNALRGLIIWNDISNTSDGFMVSITSRFEIFSHPLHSPLEIAALISQMITEY